jgi:MFS family permease
MAFALSGGWHHGGVLRNRNDSVRPTLRTVLVLVSTIALLDVLFYSAIAPLLPTYSASLDLSKTQAGLLTGAYALGTLIASMPAGWLATHHGTRLTLLLGLGLLGAASIAFGLATSFPVLTTARLVQGIGGAASWAAGLAWLVEVAPRDKRGQLIGVVLGIGIAGAVGGPVLGAVAAQLGPVKVFPAVAVVAAGLAVAVAVTGTSGQPPLDHGNVRNALRDRRVLNGAWLTTLPALFSGTYTVLVPLRLSALGASASEIAFVFLLAAAVESIVSPVVGRVSDIRGRLLPLRTGLGGVLLACLVLPRPHSVWGVSVAVIFAAGVGGMLFTPASALLSDGAEVAGLPQGLVFGLFNLVWAGGQIGGAAGGAGLADATNDTVAYLVVAVLAMISLLALGPVRARLTGRRPRALRRP